MTPPSDLELLHRAARLAIRGHGGVEPNPMVGCVITDGDGVVVGSGYHHKCGEGHAEVNAIENAGGNANGGTAYITLEPCNHLGRTPPCTEEILRAGITRVVIGVEDPHSEAACGAAFLKREGLEVSILNDETCRDLVAPFAYRLQTGLDLPAPWH